MSLPAGQQRILDGIAEVLRANEPRLASMFAIFTRLSKDEPPPRREQLTVAGPRALLIGAWRRPPRWDISVQPWDPPNDVAHQPAGYRLCRARHAAGPVCSRTSPVPWAAHGWRRRCHLAPGVRGAHRGDQRRREVAAPFSARFRPVMHYLTGDLLPEGQASSPGPQPAAGYPSPRGGSLCHSVTESFGHWVMVAGCVKL